MVSNSDTNELKSSNEFYSIVKNKFLQKTKKTNFTLLTYEELEKQINQENNINIKDLFKNNPIKANELINKYSNKFDAVFLINFIEYKTQIVHVPEKTHWERTRLFSDEALEAFHVYPGDPNYDDMKYMGAMGTFETDPAYDFYQGVVTLNLKLLDAHTNETIFSRLERRTHGKDNIDVATRIIASYLHDSLNLIEKINKRAALAKDTSQNTVVNETADNAAGKIIMDNLAEEKARDEAVELAAQKAAEAKNTAAQSPKTQATQATNAASAVKDKQTSKKSVAADTAKVPTDKVVTEKQSE